MSDKAVCRTAPATPGLLITLIKLKNTITPFKFVLYQYWGFSNIKQTQTALQTIVVIDYLFKSLSYYL